MPDVRNILLAPVKLAVCAVSVVSVNEASSVTASKSVGTPATSE